MKGMLAMFLLGLYECFARHDMSFAAVVAAAIKKVHVVKYLYYTDHEHVGWIITSCC